VGAPGRAVGAGRMKGHGRFGLLFGAALAGGLIAAGVRAGADGLIVVHDAGGTVPAAPWVEHPALSEERAAAALERARARLGTLGVPPGAGHVVTFPVSAAPLRPGRAERVRVRGLGATLFAIGPDDASLAWLDANAAALRSRGAQGFLVRADTPGTLHRVRERAARLGLTLDPLPGAALAEAFGASSYPFVAEPAW